MFLCATILALVAIAGVQCGSPYRMYDEPKNWAEAAVRCTMDGADLFYPTSARQSAEIFKEADPKVDGIWIGVHRMFTNETLTTIDGNRDMYARWGRGEPRFKGIYWPSTVLSRENLEFSISEWNIERYFVCVLRMQTNYVAKEDAALNGFKVLDEFGASYKYVDAKVGGARIQDANTICASQKSEVFYPKSNSESAAVFEKIVPAEDREILIGIHDIFRVGHLTTIDGNTEFHTNWESSHPVTEPRAVKLRRDTKFISELQEDYNVRFVCKRKIKAN